MDHRLRSQGCEVQNVGVGLHLSWLWFPILFLSWIRVSTKMNEIAGMSEDSSVMSGKVICDNRQLAIGWKSSLIFWKQLLAWIFVKCHASVGDLHAQISFKLKHLYNCFLWDFVVIRSPGHKFGGFYGDCFNGLVDLASVLSHCVVSYKSVLRVLTVASC